jgi:uncharacterized protein YraI
MLNVCLSSPWLPRLIVAAILLLPIQTFAESTSTLRAVNMRAGPDRAFPLVTWLPQRTPVHIFGCLSGGQWCDVSHGRNRGWVDSSYLATFFRDRTPVVTFSVEEYWDAHFQRRSWYADRSKWLNWGTPAFRP